MLPESSPLHDDIIAVGTHAAMCVEMYLLEGECAFVHRQQEAPASLLQVETQQQPPTRETESSLWLKKNAAVPAAGFPTSAFTSKP